jgi:hypothetical protein
LYHKKIFFLIIINLLIGQDTTKIDNNMMEISDNGKNGADSTNTSILDTSLTPIPKLRDDKDTLSLLPLGKPFFNYDIDIKQLQNQIDSLGAMVSLLQKFQAMPTLNQDIINLIKVPDMQHRIELTNGTVVMGEIIDENSDALFIQTTLGRLAITKDKVVSVQQELPPGPKVEMVGEPNINVFPDREEIIGTVINSGEIRADFVRTEAKLWSPSTELIVIDSAFVDGNIITYKSGVISDTSLKPGETANFKIIIQKPSVPEVGYRTYAIRWARTF